MRILVTTLLMVVAGFLAGGLVAQGLAVETGADQEFILVFVAIACILVVSSVVFFAVQFFTDVRKAAGVAMRILLGFIVVAALILIVIDLIDQPDHGAIARSWPIIVGLTLPNAILVVVQWLIVRYRNPGPMVMPMFGRDAGRAS